MGKLNDKFFYLLLLADGYAVLNTYKDTLPGCLSIDELIKYLQDCNASREDIQFVEVEKEDFTNEKKARILSALPLSCINGGGCS